MKRINITQAAAVIGVAGLLGVASLAIAGDQKPAVKPAVKTAPPAITDPASLPKFAHVVVVNSTPAQRAAYDAKAKPAMAAGQRAYSDAESGRLRQITAEDLAAEASATNTSAPAASSSPTEVTATSGRALAVGESSYAYAVAHIDSKGKARQACVENQPNGEAALKAAANIAEENTNEK